MYKRFLSLARPRNILLTTCLLLQVVDMCITALPETHDDKALGLYNHWIKMFPYNKALVGR